MHQLPRKDGPQYHGECCSNGATQGLTPWNKSACATCDQVPHGTSTVLLDHTATADTNDLGSSYQVPLGVNNLSCCSRTKAEFRDINRVNSLSHRICFVEEVTFGIQRQVVASLEGTKPGSRWGERANFRLLGIGFVLVPGRWYMICSLRRFCSIMAEWGAASCLPCWFPVASALQLAIYALLPQS